MFMASSYAFSSEAEVGGDEQKSTLPMIEYQQLDYVYLNALPGADDGYCVVTHNERGEILDLITTEGAVSEGQIKKAVRYASYPEQAYMGVPVWLVGSFAMSSMINPIVGIPIAAGAQLGFMGYFLHKGVEEEESSKATLLSVASFFPNSIIVEIEIRKSRAKHLTDEDRSLTFSSEERGWRWVKFLGFKKLDHMAGRLQEMPPEFPQGCDYLR